MGNRTGYAVVRIADGGYIGRVEPMPSTHIDDHMHLTLTQMRGLNLVLASR